jgi:pyruvate/2-oxoglutarate dehydrogenase complex dihydrolipoamide dehydrogenase (E3) component
MKQKLLSLCPIADAEIEQLIAKFYDIDVMAEPTEEKVFAAIAPYDAVIVPYTGPMLISERVIDADGVFIAVGITPRSGFVGTGLETNAGGYIVAGETCETSIPGVFAAGDVRAKQLRQVVTAVADGANAVTSVQRYLIESKEK